MHRFQNKRAVVTGGAHGIGRAIVLRLLAEGASVAVLDCDAAALDVLAATQVDDAARITCIAADLMEPTAVEDAFSQVRQRLGAVDVLINNVGRSLRQDKGFFGDLPPPSWQLMLDACLLPAMACSRAVADSMRQRRRGRIVNIASDSALVGPRADAPYGAAKAAVIGFTRSLAREMAPFDVTVNAVAPGYIRTRAMDGIAPDFAAKAVAETPMGRMGQPDEVAAVVAFLGSDDASFVTGQTLIVNGGRWFN